MRNSRNMWKLMLVGILLACALSLTGCAAFTTVPVEQAAAPPETVTIVKPEITGKVSAGLDVWCANLTNIRRIVLRVIHVVDPEWQSVCVTRQAGNPGE